MHVSTECQVLWDEMKGAEYYVKKGMVLVPVETKQTPSVGDSNVAHDAAADMICRENHLLSDSRKVGRRVRCEKLEVSRK
jgi:hypothetical protein